MEQDNNKKQRLLIVILLLITIISILITLWAVFIREPTVKYIEYELPSIDENLEKITDNTANNSTDLESSVWITYSKEVEISKSENKAYIQFSNGEASTEIIIIQLYLEDKLIAESGSILNGYKLETMSLNDNLEDLENGTYDGKFLLLHYDLESGEKTIVNTEIPVEITIHN